MFSSHFGSPRGIQQPHECGKGVATLTRRANTCGRTNLNGHLSIGSVSKRPDTYAKESPENGYTVFLSLVTLGIYGVVYVARRWRELFDELADVRDQLGQIQR